MLFIAVNSFLVFQPIFNLQTKKIAGCEALLRWKHPNLGVRLPNEFMKTMEETALITNVGEWVLVEACKAAVTWPGIYAGRSKCLRGSTANLEAIVVRCQRVERHQLCQLDVSKLKLLRPRS